MTLAIIIPIISILLALTGFYYRFIRKKSYPGEILFFEEGCISLINSIKKNFPEISIRYNENEIQEDIIYFKGLIVNSGEIDIEESMVDKPLTINLPNGYKWLQTTITQGSPELNADYYIINDQNNAFRINGLFKKYEFIRFESLIEKTKPNHGAYGHLHDLIKNLVVKHRISNVRDVIIQSGPGLSLKDLRKALWIHTISILIGFIFSFGLGYLGFYFSNKTDNNIYYKKNSTGELFLLKSTTKDNAILKNLASNESEVIKAVDLNKLFTYTIPIDEDKRLAISHYFLVSSILISISVLFLLGILVLISTLKSRYKDYKAAKVREKIVS